MRLKDCLLCLILVLVAGCTTTGSRSTKPYPLDTCLVTDNALGSMGDSVSFMYQDQEVKFCCKPCIKKFEVNPEKYLAKLHEAK
ncbi:MAG: hypothetical protein IIC50_24120 [Planctomycetes bacterium]|nr:hypothetical protein [Planctomycetota bacterium]